MFCQKCGTEITDDSQKFLSQVWGTAEFCRR